VLHSHFHSCTQHISSCSAEFYILWGCRGSAGELIVYLTYRKELLEAMELELHFLDIKKQHKLASNTFDPMIFETVVC
jgi:hypothetical protein